MERMPDGTTPARRADPPRVRAAPAPDGEPAVTSLIVAQGLVKRFERVTAVAGVDFEVLPGDFLGFLGPNGAGKTTLMKLIYGLAEPTEGTLTVFGQEVRRSGRDIKRRLGVVPQENNLDPDLSVWDNLKLYGRYFGLRGPALEARAAELLDFMQLDERRDTVIMKLSGGMKRRLVIARALLNQPEVVILDEPTTGLDPQVRHLIWDRLAALRNEGITFLLTTHYMEEAQNLCNRLLIMDEGSIIARGEPLELVRTYVGEHVLELAADPKEDRAIADAFPDLERQWSGRQLYLYARRYDDLLPVMERYAGRDARVRPASVEDVFLKLTGREIRE